MDIKPDILEILVGWGNTISGLRAKRHIGTLGDDDVAQFYTAKGYNNYKRTGIWLASCTPDVFIWGPVIFGNGGGGAILENGQPGYWNAPPWLNPADPEFFNKLHRVLFRFHKKEKKP